MPFGHSMKSSKVVEARSSNRRVGQGPCRRGISGRYQTSWGRSRTYKLTTFYQCKRSRLRISRMTKFKFKFRRTCLNQSSMRAATCRAKGRLTRATRDGLLLWRRKPQRRRRQRRVALSSRRHRYLRPKTRCGSRSPLRHGPRTSLWPPRARTRSNLLDSPSSTTKMLDGPLKLLT